ncbi:MAG: Ig-like domain-containing protein, partial [Clostridia bacterium]|nr:Ig-like domain-containing protein [Clostridia bacterium]
MKKIIICMLLLLPLIIVASVLLAVDIISVEAYIPVERVELNQSYLELNLSDGSYSGLVATVYPTSAKDKKVTWSITDEVKTVPGYEGRAAEVDGNGKVSFFTYSTFKIVASAAGKKAECIFYIKGDKPEQVVIESDATSLATGESALLSAVFHPVDAVVGEVLWYSSNTAVLSVDNNGIVTALSAGEAVVSVEIPGTGIKAQKRLSVTQGITPFGAAFYAADAFSLTGMGDVTVVSGGHIEGGKLYFEGDSAVLATEIGQFTVYKCQADDIAIQNATFFGEDFKLKVGKLPLTLSVVYLDKARTERPPVTWTSSDTTVAEIDAAGLVMAKNTGMVTFTAVDSQSDKTVALVVRVVKPVSLIVLDMPDDKRGIAQQRIYGNTDYNSGAYSLSFIDINFSLPRSADVNEFTYSSSDETLAYFEGNRLHFTANISGVQRITVKVSAKERPYESVEVFRLYDILVGEGVNCSDYSQLKAVTAAGKAAFLQSNINYGSNAQSIVLIADLYGNGFDINGLEYALENSDDLMENTEFVKIAASGVLLSNIRLAFENPEKMSISDGMKGSVLTIGEIDQPTRYEGIIIEYSIIENGYYSIVTHNSDIGIKGCIIRNASNFGVVVATKRRTDGGCDYSNVTMENNIMSNIVAPAITVSADDPNLEEQGSLHIKGFLDIYNWQDITSSRMLDRTIIKGNKTMDDFVKGLLKNMLANEFIKPAYDHVRYTVDQGNTRTNYLHLAIIQAGALHESTAEIIIEDEQYMNFELEILKTVG